jgi:site-specific recombinase XerD
VPFVFVSERGGRLSTEMIARIIQRAWEATQLGFHVHPHMLRHSTGHMLAKAGTGTRLTKTSWAMRRSLTRCDTPNWRRPD